MAENSSEEAPLERAVLSEPFRFFDINEIQRLPRPSWLIPGVLPAYGISIIYGQPGHGKSFLALDWALSIGTGTAWAGREVERQHVVYVAAEGILGYAPRAEAWLEANQAAVGHTAPLVHFLSHPIQLGEAAEKRFGLDAFETTLKQQGLAPRLVILDTLSRCIAGSDENSTKSLSAMITAVEAAAIRLDAAFLLVHHTRKKDDEIRGSGVLAGAANMTANVKLYAKEKAVKLVCTKMKDGDRYSPFEFAFTKVADSAVLTFSEEATKEDDPDEMATGRPISENWTFVLNTLPSDGATRTHWRAAVETKLRELGDEAPVKMARETIYHAIRKLADLELVILQGGKFTRAEGNSELVPTP